MASDDENATELTKGNDECRIQEFKLEKRNAKSLMTRLLNKLAGVLCSENPQDVEIKDLLARIEE